MKSSRKLKAIVGTGILAQHQHHPLEWKELGYSIHILPWISWYYGTF